ncbi:hypothetical protein AAG570_000801 [Ranatra chinensis]|uniref:Aminopeptidase n=1 Tax=Ranatra chinensis TaxID=642074 RepID=A0ABD0ZJC6_9HEMI
MQFFGILTVVVLATLAQGFYQRPKFPIEPKGYRLDLNPHPAEGTFKGRIRIDIINRGADPVTSLELNCHDSLVVAQKDIKFIRLANADLSDEESDEDVPISVSKVERRDELLIAHFSMKLQRDATYQLDIPFEGILGSSPNHPFYRGSYIDQTTTEKRWFVVLSPKEGEAHRIFPCFNKPFLKSWFEVSVVHKREYTALSNMPAEERSNLTKEGGLVREQFARTPLMTVNSLGLFISDFKMPQVEYLQTDGIKIGLWGRTDFVATLSKAQQLLPSVLVSLELYLSRPYPLPHLNLIALPGYMEDTPKNSWGLQWFKESDLMNGNAYWLTHRIAKSAAMQWLSHLATPINESATTSGLANFLATVVARQLEPTMYDWNLASFQTLVLELGKPWNYGLDRDQTKMLLETRITLLIQMFEQVFGPSTFKQSIQNFLAKKEFKVYSEEDLWQVITEQAWADKRLEPTLSLGEITKQWIAKRIPLVTVSTDFTTNTTTFTQEEFLNNLENSWSKVVKKGGVEKQAGWWLPLIASTGETTEPTALITWLKPEQHYFTCRNFTTTSALPILNPGSIGPYLVNYNTESWAKLSDNMGSLSATVRSQLLHDSLTLALSGHLSTVTALQVTSFLKTEQSAEVWRTFYPLAERLRKRFQGTTAAQNLDAYLKSLLIPVLDALGEEDKSVWKTELRIKTRHLLCQTGFSPCVDNARTLFAIWVNATHPDEGIPIASSHLCPVMAWGNFEEWQFALNRLLNFPSNRSRSERNFLLKTVTGCPHDPRKYEALFNKTFLDENYSHIFTDEDKFIILSAVSGESIGYTTLFNFLKSNWEILREKIKGSLWEYLIQSAMGNFRTEDGLQQVTELLQEKKEELGTALSAAEDCVNRVGSRVKWAQDSTPAVEAWLNTTMEASWPPQRFKFQETVVVSHNRKTI